jgi:hypothetical protein
VAVVLGFQPLQSGTTVPASDKGFAQRGGRRGHAAHIGTGLMRKNWAPGGPSFQSPQGNKGLDVLSTFQASVPLSFLELRTAFIFIPRTSIRVNSSHYLKFPQCGSAAVPMIMLECFTTHNQGDDEADLVTFSSRSKPAFAVSFAGLSDMAVW